MTDVVILGSGPSGARTAFPLVESGHSVVMVDAGSTRPKAIDAGRADLRILRQGGGDAWRHLLGDDLSGLQALPNLSPKMRFAASRDFTAGFTQANRIVSTGFEPVGALAFGGLSNVWGAAVGCFDDTDLAGSGLTVADLAPSYARIAQHIGISGSTEDDLSEFFGTALPVMPGLPLSPLMAELLARYGIARHRLTIRLGRARNAVLSQAVAGRSACLLDNACLYGCGAGAVYNSANDVEQLKTHQNFRWQGDTVVTSIGRTETGWQLTGHDRSSGEARTMQARTAILAAGAIPTTRLVVDLLGRVDEELPLLNAPCFAMLFTMPRRIGGKLPDKGFALAQLGVRVPLPDSYAFGCLYTGDGVAASDLAEALPFTRPAAAMLVRTLMPSLALGVFYLPGSYSANSLAVHRNADGAEIHVHGAWGEPATRAARQCVAVLAKQFRPLGLYHIPSAVKFFPPGAEVHAGGTLARAGITDRDGAVVGEDGLYAADASVLGCFPAKHPTFTIMANADRIGRQVAARLRGAG